MFNAQERRVTREFHGRKRRRARRRALHSFGRTRPDDVACTNTPRGTRSILGTVGGAVGGAAVVLGIFFAAMTKDRALQKAAGAPAPKPGVLTVGAGVLAAVGGGFLGNKIATKRPDC